MTVWRDRLAASIAIIAFINDLKMKDFVTSIAFTEEQVCGQTFLRDFAGACGKMSPLVEFTTRALGQEY